MKKTLLLSFAAATVAFAGCSSMNMTSATSAGMKALQAMTISDAEIEGYVSEYIQQLDAENTIATGNDAYNVRLNRIAGKINGVDGINIKVYKTQDVNAFAVADGNVRIYSGLMDIMSDEEVLGVIGHEIGHIKLKHTKEAFKNALLTSALRDGISSVGGRVGALSQSQLGDLGEALASSQFSQKQEFEADNYGYDFLKAHGLNPIAMALSFQKLQQMEAQAGSNASGPILQLFSTHPNLNARISNMVERATKDGYLNNGSATTGGTSTTKQQSTGTGKWAY
ncbi:M48 family metallopeptidase [Alistipes sp. OttesenSCG-928-B03]|nr:M48 family metallopeptidase [Alistipes sp. OttesenSCG-928-B03]